MDTFTTPGHLLTNIIISTSIIVAIFTVSKRYEGQNSNHVYINSVFHLVFPNDSIMILPLFFIKISSLGI